MGLLFLAAVAVAHPELRWVRFVQGRAVRLDFPFDSRYSLLEPSQLAGAVGSLLLGLVLDVELDDPVRDGRRLLGARPLDADCNYAGAALLHDLQAGVEFVGRQLCSVSSLLG